MCATQNWKSKILRWLLRRRRQGSTQNGKWTWFSRRSSSRRPSIPLRRRTSYTVRGLTISICDPGRRAPWSKIHMMGEPGITLWKVKQWENDLKCRTVTRPSACATDKWSGSLRWRTWVEITFARWTSLNQINSSTRTFKNQWKSRAALLASFRSDLRQARP